MKIFGLSLLISVLSIGTAFGQNTAQTTPLSENKIEEVKYRHSLGASLWMLLNFSEESADYYLLTYGYRISKRDRVFAEYNTWKYEEPIGAYGDSDELYPGFVRTHGIGFGYQRFLWKGIFSTAQATPFLKQYYDEQDEKIQKGFQLYLQLAVGYRFEFFKERLYVEPAYALKYWPIDTNFPTDFAVIEAGTPNTIFEPSLNFGYRF